MNSRDEKATTFLVGMIFGGIIGSILTALYTPYSGKKMRRVINSKTNDIVDDVSEYIETGKQKAEVVYKDGIKKAESIISDTKKIFD